MAKEEISESRPMQVQSADKYEGRLMLKEQLCNLKYKCIVSIAILLVLLLETIARRIEESVKNPTSSTQLLDLWTNFTLASNPLRLTTPAP